MGNSASSPAEAEVLDYAKGEGADAFAGDLDLPLMSLTLAVQEIVPDSKELLHVVLKSKSLPMDTFWMAYVRCLLSDPKYAELAQQVMTRAESINEVCTDKLCADLLFAAESGQTEEALKLIELDTPIDISDENGTTPLMFAAKADSPALIRVLLDKGAQIDLQEDHGATALMLAVQGGAMESVAALIGHGAKLDLVTNECWTALMVAAQNGAEVQVGQLLAAGAQVDLREEDGWTALLLAVQSDKCLGCTKRLLDKGANFHTCANNGASALMVAVGGDNEQPQTVKLLLELGGRELLLLQTGDDQVSALMLAAQNDLWQVTRLMLGLSLDESEKTGEELAMEWAVAVRIQALVRARLVRVRHVRAICERTGSALAMPGTIPGSSGCYEMYDKENNQTAVAEFVVAGGEWEMVGGPWSRRVWRKCEKKERGQVSVEEPTVGTSAGLVAAVAASVDAATVPELLLLADIDGFTALHFAAKQDSTKVAALLLQMATAGLPQSLPHTIAANEKSRSEQLRGIVDAPTARSNGSLTALMLAAQNGSIGVCKQLVKLAAWGGGPEGGRLLQLDTRADAEMHDGWGALMFATHGQHLHVVQLLLASGCNVNLRSTDGATPLMLAVEQKNFEIASELIHFRAEEGAAESAEGHCRVDLQTNEGVTALLLATFEYSVELVQLLLDAGAPVEQRTQDGYTVLMVAAQAELVASRKAADIASMVLEKAEADRLVQGGPEDAAKEAQQPSDAVRRLLDAQTPDGWTALMIAAQHGTIQVLEVLLAWGADCTPKNEDGYTAFMLAEETDAEGGRDAEAMLKEAEREQQQVQRLHGDLGGIQARKHEGEEGGGERGEEEEGVGKVGEEVADSSAGVDLEVEVELQVDGTVHRLLVDSTVDLEGLALQFCKEHGVEESEAPEIAVELYSARQQAANTFVQEQKSEGEEEGRKGGKEQQEEEEEQKQEQRQHEEEQQEEQDDDAERGNEAVEDAHHVPTSSTPRKLKHAAAISPRSKKSNATAAAAVSPPSPPKPKRAFSAKRKTGAFRTL
jgi:ankyrin repeat protein